MEQISVHKFGGASVKNADYIRQVARIIQSFSQSKIVLVVSAIDKTTNHLELLADYAQKLDETKAAEQLAKIKNFHHNIVQELFGNTSQTVLNKLSQLFEELHQIISGVLLLGDFPDRTYDRIMSFGELLSSIILQEYLLTQKLTVSWVDSREIIITDSQVGQSDVIWSLTERKVKKVITPLLEIGYVLTQGYIAANTEGKTTTLGREGSDYTAAIIAACLEAQQVSVWKDVPGVLTQDPRFFKNPEYIPRLSYEQAIEMTYAGASVLHPKTLKPLFQKKIPLQVRSFLEPQQSGTLIGSYPYLEQLPIKLKKTNLAAVQFKLKEFNYLTNSQVVSISNIVSELNLSIYFLQLQARSLFVCVENRPEELQKLREISMDNYEILIWSPISKLTIHNDIGYHEADSRIISKQELANNLTIIIQEPETTLK